MRMNLTIRFSLILLISLAISACQYEKTDTTQTRSSTLDDPASISENDANNDPSAAASVPPSGTADTAASLDSTPGSTTQNPVADPTPDTSANQTTNPVVTTEEPVATTPKVITLSHIDVTLAQPYLRPSLSTNLRVQAVYDDSSLVDVTSQTGWNIADNTIVDLVSDTTLLALKAGKTTVTATYQGKTATINVNVQHADIATLHVNGITSEFIELSNINSLGASYDATGALVQSYGGSDARPGTGFTFEDENTHLFVFAFDSTTAPEAPAYVRFQQNGIDTIYTLSSNYRNKIDFTNKPTTIGGIYLANFDLGLCDSTLTTDDCLLPENQLLVNGSFEITRDKDFSAAVTTDRMYPQTLATSKSFIFEPASNNKLYYYKYPTIAGSYQFKVSTLEVEMSIYDDAGYSNNLCTTKVICQVTAPQGNLYITLRYTGTNNGTSFTISVTPPTQGTLAAPLALSDITFAHKGSVTSDGASFYRAAIDPSLVYQLKLYDKSDTSSQNLSLEIFSDSDFTNPIGFDCAAYNASKTLNAQTLSYDSSADRSLCIKQGPTTPASQIYIKIGGSAGVNTGLFFLELALLREGKNFEPLDLTMSTLTTAGTYAFNAYGTNSSAEIILTSDKYLSDLIPSVNCPASLASATYQTANGLLAPNKSYCFTVSGPQSVYALVKETVLPQNSNLKTQLFIDDNGTAIAASSDQINYSGQMSPFTPVSATGNNAGIGGGSFYGATFDSSHYYALSITGLKENAQLYINQGFGTQGSTICSAVGNAETGMQCTFTSDWGWATINLLSSRQGSPFNMVIKKLDPAEYTVYQVETHPLPNNGLSESSPYKAAFTYTTIFNADSSQVLARRPVSADNYTTTRIALKSGEEIKIRVSDAYGGLGHYAVGIRPANAQGPAAISPKTLIPLVDQYEPADNRIQNATVIDQPGVFSYHSFSKDANGYTDEDWFSFTAP